MTEASQPKSRRRSKVIAPRHGSYVDATKLDEVTRLIAAGDQDTLKTTLNAWPIEAFFELLVELPLKSASRLFSWMEVGKSAAVLAELKPEYRALLTQDSTVERLREILDRMPVDEAADTLNELPSEIQQQLIPHLEHADALSNRLQQPKDTVGRVMSRQLLALTADRTVEDAIAEVREHAETIRRLDDITVIDDNQRPIGTVRLKRLLLLPSDALLGDVMSSGVSVVSAETDQENITRLTAHENLNSVPVVDNDGRLIGQIGVRQLQRIMHDEATEDLSLINKLPVDGKPSDPITQIVKGRLPWLLAGLVGATMAAIIVGAYEDELERAAIVAAFIPVVISLAGNAGLQASAVTVQALATGSIWARELDWRFFRELGGSVVNGLVAGAILAILIAIATPFLEIEQPLHLAIAVSFSLLAVIVIAALVGTFVPMALKRAGIDPAAATGVFITTSNDVLGVMIYFILANEIYFIHF
ncbi:MAG: magnesium transporter [Pseudomonadota bacterium]